MRSDVVFKILILIVTLGCKKYRLSPKLENKTQDTKAREDEHDVTNEETDDFLLKHGLNGGQR